ncbi:MAG TPA: hypothetical protein DCS09_08600 [Porphyromonadaceae bacterium]|nr:hypothetical protein [Porphyromonadaceae bacterium]
MEQLLPCPFCNSLDVDKDGWKANDGRTGPACNDCNATADSVEIWNTRQSLWMPIETDEQKNEVL